MTKQHRLSRVPAETLASEISYVLAATGWWSRVWRSARAAWRCAQIAARAAAIARKTARDQPLACGPVPETRTPVFEGQPLACGECGSVISHQGEKVMRLLPGNMVRLHDDVVDRLRAEVGEALFFELGDNEVRLFGEKSLNELMFAQPGFELSLIAALGMYDCDEDVPATWIVTHDQGPWVPGVLRTRRIPAGTLLRAPRVLGLLQEWIEAEGENALLFEQGETLP